MTPRPPRSTRTDTLFPSAPLFRAGGHARPVRAPDGVEQRDSVIGHAVAHHLAEAAVVGQADMLEHADRDDAVELPGEGAIIDTLELHPVGNARLGGPALGHGALLLRQADAPPVHLGAPVEVERNPAPAAPHAPTPLPPPPHPPPADMPLLLPLPPLP